MTEQELQIQVADYLRLQYPQVVFHSDYGSGAKLTPRQAIVQKRQNGGQRGWLDLFLAHPVYKNPYGTPTLTPGCFGLFLELKKDGVRLKKKNGEWATPHIAEQAEMMEKLRARGYVAEFAVGFAEAKKLIDGYLEHPMPNTNDGRLED